MRNFAKNSIEFPFYVSFLINSSFYVAKIPFMWYD